MKKYRFYITNKEKARAEMRTWAGRVNVCVADVLAVGFIDQYIITPDPEATAQRFANRIGADSWRAL